MKDVSELFNMLTFGQGTALERKFMEDLEWKILEVWIDKSLSVPYVLLLLETNDKTWKVIDAKDGKVWHSSTSYEEAKNYLLEDEYERVEGRVNYDD